MMGREHATIGVVSAGTLMWIAQSSGAPLGPVGALTLATAAGLGSLAPDIDHPRSLIGNRIPLMLAAIGLMFCIWAGITWYGSRSEGMFQGVLLELHKIGSSLVGWGLVLLVLGLLGLWVSVKVSTRMQHRGPIHSLLVAGAATLAAIIMSTILGLGAWVGLAFGFGWFLHLAADATTPAGLPALLWPFAEREIPRVPRGAALLLVSVALLGLVGWTFSVAATMANWAPVPVEMSSGNPPPNQAGNVTLACQRLREASPEIAAALVDPSAPVIEIDGGYVSYTWEYIKQLAPDQVEVARIRITLDSSGQIVGAGAP